jgi:hypothetical protein
MKVFSRFKKIFLSISSTFKIWLPLNNCMSIKSSKFNNFWQMLNSQEMIEEVSNKINNSNKLKWVINNNWTKLINCNNNNLNNCNKMTNNSSNKTKKILLEWTIIRKSKLMKNLNSNSNLNKLQLSKMKINKTV